MNRQKEAEEYLGKHEQLRSLYATRDAMLREVEDVYRALFNVDRDLPEVLIETVGTGRAQIILQKMITKIAIRSDKVPRVVQRSNTDAERERCDTLEKILISYYDMLADATDEDLFAMAGAMIILRGSGAIQTVNARGLEDPQIRQFVLDPLEYWCMRGANGIEFYTTERWMSSWEAKDYIEALGFSYPNFDEDEEGITGDSVRLVEYWDKEKVHICVAGHYIAGYEHGYGCINIAEGFYQQMPSKDPEWRSRPAIASVLNELRGQSALLSRMMDAFDLYAMPFVIAKSDGGITPIRLDRTEPGEMIDMPLNTEVQVVSPQPNFQLFREALGAIKKEISDGTLTETAFNQEIPDASGHLYNSVLGQIQDDLAHIRASMERTFNKASNTLFKFLYLFAPPEGWEFPIEARGNQRRMMVNLTPDEIGEKNMVKWTIRPSLPENRIQKVTELANLAAVVNPVTGLRDFPLHDMMQLTGLLDEIPDMQEFENRRTHEMLMQSDEEYKNAYIKGMKADVMPQMMAWQKKAQQSERKFSERERNIRQKAIEEGMDTGIYWEAEQARDPQVVMQYLQNIQKGMLPQDAWRAASQPSPFAPGQQDAQQANGQNAHNTAMQLYGGEQNPLNGLETGAPTPTSVSPPAEMGAMPRQVYDQTALAAEAMQQEVRRGVVSPDR